MAQQILLVDDEEGIRKVLSISLADKGYHVSAAKDGLEALNIFRETGPTIVLTDIKMPGMDGIQLLKEIKKESPRTQVIMITGHGDMKLAIQSLKFDATDFVTKPIDDDVLEIALKRANERITLETELRKYTEDLTRLVEEKTRKLVEAKRLAAVGQTVAGVAHAIKNIAGGLTGGGFVLEKGIELNNEKYLRQGWDMVKGNVGRIKGMALDLLGFVKEKEPDYQVCDPNRPAQDVADLMLPHARRYGITFVVDLEQGCPHVFFDPEGIHRCLLNLVTNAMDACTDMDCTQIQTRVLLRSRKIDGWAVEYQVMDNGCGMNDETREKIFQSFFSTKGSRGTGLGLMITKKIIDEHHGIIELESERGKGTKFLIRLPERDQPPGRDSTTPQ